MDITNTQFNENLKSDLVETFKKKKEKMEQKLREVTDKVSSSISNENGNPSNYSIYKQLVRLSTKMNKVDEVLNKADNQQLFSLYKRYRKVFKFFKKNETLSNQLTQMSQGIDESGQVDQAKMDYILQSIKLISDQLKEINKAIINSQQKYIYWLDFNDTYENRQFLRVLQQDFDGNFTVQFFTKSDSFRMVMEQQQNSQVVIVMSGQAAGDCEKYNNGKNLNWLKTQLEQNKLNIKVKGCIVFTSLAGQIHLEYLRQEYSNILQEITSYPQHVYEFISNITDNIDFKRVIPLIELDFYFKESTKKILLDMGEAKFEQKSLFDYDPTIVNYGQIISDVKGVFDKKKMTKKLKECFVYGLNNLEENIKKIFSDSKGNEEQLASMLLSAYTQENLSIYHVLNTILNLVNENLILKFIKVIELFNLAFYKYDDLYDKSKGDKHVRENATKIPQDQDSVLKLYKGTSIPKEYLDKYIKDNTIIVLPSFSSFSSNKIKAQDFMKMNKHDDNVAVLLEIHYYGGNFDQRPKYLEQITYQKCEEEYVFYPFKTFKIATVDQYKEGEYLVQMVV